MSLTQIIAQLRASLAPMLNERATARTTIDSVRAACVNESRTLTEAEAEQVNTLNARVSEIDAEVERIGAQITEYETEIQRDEAADRLSREVTPTGVTRSGGVEERIQVNERRTYNRDADRTGQGFLRDLAGRHLGNAEASERLSRHMREELVERDGQIDRAATTGAFSGLVVPQYLTELYAGLARAGRPFADACRHHDLPETGMTAYIAKGTTGTTSDDQSAEGALVSETDYDDTLESVSIVTNAGSQSISRQALERGIGVESTTMQDLFEAHATSLDNKLLNKATVGLSAVATSIAYTDATPTAAELYPKLLAAPAAVEAALLNKALGGVIAVMNSRRWYWLQSQLTSTWPMFGQVGISPQNGGVDYGKTYGAGFRGVLPSGVAVIVDNNVATNKGAGTNEDEIYFGERQELHLWEDPNAPMLIRAEQNQAKKLLVDFVVYSYYAHKFDRYAHAQKINGTGLVTPTF